MKIAVLSSVVETVPPQRYGGTELVVYYLVEWLVRFGHRVTLFAAEGSRTSAKLVPIGPPLRQSAPTNTTGAGLNDRKRLSIQRACDDIRNGSFDILHNHTGGRLFDCSAFVAVPILTTLHGNVADPRKRPALEANRAANFVSISHSQSAALPDLNYIDTIYNGIDVDDYIGAPDKRENYFAFLGRISPEKGIVEAIRVARRLKVPLRIAAKIDPVDVEYYRACVEPLIDGELISYIGEIGMREKVAFLTAARALVAPIQWPEPFGMVFIEAMACGTPVIALCRGAVPEIVRHGSTGWVCNSVEEMESAMTAVTNPARERLRQYVRSRFSGETMARRYVRAYESVVERAASVR